VPSGEELVWHQTNGQVPDETWVKIVAALVWVTWAQLAAALISELAATLRHRPTRRPRLVAAPIQRLAVHLVAAVTLLGPLHPAAALGPSALSLANVTTTAEAAATAIDITAPDGSGPHNRIEPPIGSASGVEGRDVHVTVRRDTWASLARAWLGDEGRWSEIRSLNLGRIMPDGTQIDSSTMRLGVAWPLIVPQSGAASPLGAAAPVRDVSVEHSQGGELIDLAPGWADGAYTVEPDDSLWTMTTGDGWSS
jgi:hypothetical protein